MGLTLSNVYAIGQIFNVLNGQIFEKQCSNLVTLEGRQFGW